MINIASRVREVMTALNVPLEQRTKYLSIAVGKAVAYAQPLPTSRLDSPVLHYNQVVLPNVEHAIAGINEVSVLDVPTTITIALKVWLIRYRIAHEPTFINSNTLLNSIAAVDRVSLSEYYGDAFTEDNYPKVDRLIGAIGKDLEAIFNPQGQ